MIVNGPLIFSLGYQHFRKNKTEPGPLNRTDRNRTMLHRAPFGVRSSVLVRRSGAVRVSGDRSGAVRVCPETVSGPFGRSLGMSGDRFGTKKTSEIGVTHGHIRYTFGDK